MRRQEHQQIIADSVAGKVTDGWQALGLQPLSIANLLAHTHPGRKYARCDLDRPLTAYFFVNAGGRIFVYHQEGRASQIPDPLSAKWKVMADESQAASSVIDYLYYGRTNPGLLDYLAGIR